jgi:hypothetical protein
MACSRDTGRMREPTLQTSAGGCLCGAVRYEARAPLRDVVNCHCSRCRRTHGHFAAYTEVAAAELALLKDRGLGWYVADGRERGFCRDCGASLFWRRQGERGISIAAGTLDEPTGLHTVAHIFVDSKGDYYDLADDVPRFEASRESDTGGPHV